MSRLCHYLCFALLGLLLFAFPALAQDTSERILDFHSDIVVHENASMTVTETIRVNVQGFQIKHGILRDFPTRYKDAEGNPVTVWFKLRSVTRDGQPEQFETSSVSNGVSIRIGDPDVYLDYGAHTYTITYDTSRQLGFFGKYDELYWNVTGNGWDFAIDHASATVTLPAGIAASDIRLSAYTGGFGEQGKDYSTQRMDSAVAVETTAPLWQGSGLTIAVQWPIGHVARPTAMQRQGYWLIENLANIVAIVGLLLMLLYFLTAWGRVGVDPPHGYPIPQALPPEKYSPAAMRYLRNMGTDNKCFTAALISLASRGALRIEKLEDQNKYRLTRLSAAGADFPPEEAAVIGALFKAGESFEINQENRLTLVEAQEALRKELARQYEGSYFKRNVKQFGIGVGFSLLALLVTLVFALLPHSRNSWIIMSGAVIGHILMNIAFARLLPAYTVLGRQVLDRIEGFRLALHDDLPMGDPTRPSLYSAGNLPYSIALEAHNEWSRRFERVLAENTAASTDSGAQPVHYMPAWYYGPGGAWNSGSFSHFTSNFTSSLNSNISSASTPPGSSSGSGGGGSSGGGGGGGGGGGW